MSKATEKIDIRLIIEPSDPLYSELIGIKERFGIKKNTEAARFCIKAGCNAMQATQN